jgi:MerR family mercuric resistance operon transcriptional regulator
VAGLMKLVDGTHCAEARQLAEGRLADVRARLSDLWRIESLLSGLMRDFGSSRGQISCPLIAAPQRP